MRAVITIIVIGLGAAAALLPAGERSEESMNEELQVYSVESGELIETNRVTKSDEQWRSELTAEQYKVTRRHGTERAFSGALWDAKDEGVYRCVACGNDLFLSSTKFESGTGWPSFTSPVHEANVGTRKDRSLFATRTEVHCSRCGAHLGHVFPDGPRPTGLRYCLNSASLDLHAMDLPGPEHSNAE